MEELIIINEFNHGIKIGKYNENTSKILEVLQILRYTAIYVVSRIFQRIYDGINSKVESKSTIVQKMFKRTI
jgi:long-subunit acyl-CoA synthetase (AMP-forming)